MGTITFSQALLQAEAQARSTLDPALHERLSCAVALVKDGRVFQTSTGAWEVDSASTEGLVHNVNGTCSCHDAHYNHPPQGLCKHRLAVALAKRAQQLLAQPPQPVVPPVEPWPDNDHEAAPPALAPAASAPPPLPEAPASVNCHITVAGRQVQLTLRDTDEVRLLARLAAVLARLPVESKTASQPQAPLSAQQHNAAAMHRPVSGFCAVHHVEMKWNEGKEGRKGWFSHKTTEGQWCKGR